MKKLMVIAAVAMSTALSFGQTVKYSDIYNNFYDATNVLAKAGVTFDTEVELRHAVVIKANVQIKEASILKMDGGEEFLLKTMNENPSYVPSASTDESTSKVLFEKRLSRIHSGTYAKAVRSAKSFNVAKFSVSDVIRCLNENVEQVSVVMANAAIKNAGVKATKIWFRKNGKSFVAKRDAKGNVVSNPLQDVMKQLTDALNAPMYKGLNEWIEKYGAGWEKIDLKWVPSDEKMAALRNDILIDEATITENLKVLRVYYGVDGFNALVKEYNEGVK